MKTYRVNIGRKDRGTGVYDWAETVVANSPQVALEQSYEKWVSTTPSYTIPPLAECVTNVVEK